MLFLCAANTTINQDIKILQEKIPEMHDKNTQEMQSITHIKFTYFIRNLLYITFPSLRLT